MFALEWEIEFPGFDDLTAGLEEMERAFETFRVPLEQSGERAAQSIGENIVQNLDGFAPLATSTLYGTAAYRLGGPLYRTGLLADAAGDATGNVPGSGFSVTDDTATAGLDPDSELGRIGDILTRGNAANNLPPRPFARLLDSDVDAISGYFLSYVEDTVSRAFSVRSF